MTTASVPTPTPAGYPGALVEADGCVRGPIFVGAGNFYANLDGTLFSGPINADGTFSRQLDDMCEVENFDEGSVELHEAQRALGLPQKP